MNKLFSVLLLFTLIISGCTAPAATQVAKTSISSTSVAPTQTIAVNLTPVATQPVKNTDTPVATAPVATAPALQPATIDDVIQYEMKGAFDFFWEQVNTDANSPGFGLIRDRYPGSEGISSIASTGFGLTAIIIGIENGYISKQQGYDRVDGTLGTLEKLDRENGFYYHFLDMNTGKRAWESEVSSIDTSILLMGVLTAGEYFGGDIEAKAKKIYDDVNWPWFLDPAKNMFYMAYRPEKGFEGHWDFYAEQLMMYILAAGSDTHPVDATPYYTFIRHKASIGDDKPFIHSWFGSIFTYQFSHAWIDFSEYTDKEGVNWFTNSVDASMTQYHYAVRMEPKYKTLSSKAWGLTACDGPDGYNGLYGAPPSGYDNLQNVVDDTIPPSGAIGSIVFLPDQAKQAMLNYYSIEKLKGKYGFFDAYNLSKNWYDTDVIGIDKGISLLMLANYQNETVYKITMGNPIFLKGLTNLELLRNK